MAANRLALAALLVPVLASLGGCPTTPEGETVPPPFPVAQGIVDARQSITSLRADGWTVCYDETYDLDGKTLASLLAGCTGRFMMIGCGTDDGYLDLMAADARSLVLETATFAADAHHVEHGVGWYFNEDGGVEGARGSWGFFPAEAGVSRQPCDWSETETSPEKRLCWETDASAVMAGGRCGATLAPGATAKRYVLVHDGDSAPPTPFETATPITLGTPVVGTIDSGTEYDFYTFTVPAGVTHVRFQTFDALGDLGECDPVDERTDTYLTIYGPGPVWLAEDDDSAPLMPTWCEDVTVAIDAGQAWAVVSGFRAQTPPDFGWSYTLVVSDATPPPAP